MKKLTKRLDSGFNVSLTSVGVSLAGLWEAQGKISQRDRKGDNALLLSGIKLFQIFWHMPCKEALIEKIVDVKTQKAINIDANVSVKLNAEGISIVKRNISLSSDSTALRTREDVIHADLLLGIELPDMTQETTTWRLSDLILMFGNSISYGGNPPFNPEMEFQV